MTLPFGASLLDIAALGWFIVFWAGYTLYADNPHKGSKTLVTGLHDYRVRWMRRMLERSLRMPDVQLVAALARSHSLFASTSILILAGLMTLLGTIDIVHAVISGLSFAIVASKEMLEIKVLVLAFVFIHAFFKFVWSLRQFNYLMVLMGSAPAAEEKRTAEYKAFPGQAAELLTRAVNTFNRGLRAYYFGMAALAWFIHPIAFMMATIWIVAILYRREFRSKTLKTFTDPVSGPKG